MKLGISFCNKKLNPRVDKMDQGKVGSPYVAPVQSVGLRGPGPPHDNNYHFSTSLPEPELASIMTCNYYLSENSSTDQLPSLSDL